ncbi:TIM barrel protein [Inediibacterium massiliense]|uniref:TIM barrel protein n=1 Tax=Inediibacterium massiliense TaxID=1658111 RepID=UPI0006B41085|nr:TIM barrel protein [Inediibacterium massiliense]
MFKIMNLSTYDFDLAKFDHNKQKIQSFLKQNKMDGIELLYPIGWKEEIISKEMIKGVHLKYYPTWLDFWTNDQEGLLRQFESMDLVKKYYGDIKREVMVNHYKKEIEMINEMGAEYAVFHVAHVEVEHTYNYDFTYSDKEVIDAAAELLNEVFKDLDTNVTLLFENMWWPGFHMLDKNMAYRLLEKVDYKNKGFLLDTAHLMNTNLDLKNEKEGVKYIIDTINELGELKSLIKGMHLNCSLSGEYVKKQIQKHDSKNFNLGPISNEVFMHIFNIDGHKPFTDPIAKKLIDTIGPEYLVYELITNSLIDLQKYIEIQDRAVFG